MLKSRWYLFLILLVEGSSLMAVELLGAKLLAPFYGSSLYVWTAVLGITVLGLTLGYYSGGRLSAKHGTEKLLAIILSIAALLVFALPATASGVISMTSGMALIPGICLASLLLLVPPMFCFGLVGPMVVRLMAQKMETLGNIAGTVYFTSTLGGIMATFLFGFYLIPDAGLRVCSLITGLALALLPIVYLIKSAPLINSKSQAPNSKQIPNSKTQNSKLYTQNSELRTHNSKLHTQNSAIRTQNSIFLFAALEGATVMAVELMAARMLAPYFGSSLYVWGTVIGITLLSLALGYFIGGRLADQYLRLSVIHWVLLAAASFLVFMHITSQQLTLAFSGLDMLTAVIAVSLLLVLPPLVFLGMVPTLLIRYLTANVDNAGATTGRVFTVSSASGIIALPIVGFFLIPKFGLTNPSIFIGLLVAIVPLVKLLMQKKYLCLLFLPILLFSASQLPSLHAPMPPGPHASMPPGSSSSDVKVLDYSEGLLGQILVADVLKNNWGEETNDRMLFVNRMGQTVVDKNTIVTRWNYITFASSLASKLPENSRALVLGLGGGSAANSFSHLNFSVDAIELDERIAVVAKKYFALDPSVRVIIDDARHYLETTDKTYDLILFDVFKGEVQPNHVLSLECFEKAKSLLNEGGLIIVNFNGFITGETGKPGRSLYRTLEAAGLNTRLLPTPGEEKDRNLLFIAGKTAPDFSTLRSPLLFKGRPVGLDSLFLDTGSVDLADAVVFTDNKPDLDKLNIKANNIWRKAYNDSYIRFFLNNGVPLFR